MNTSPPIHRKPLPARSDSLQQRSGPDNVTPVTESAGSGSFTGHRIDAEGFGQVRAQHSGSPTPQTGVRRYDTMISQASSRYDDGASTSSLIMLVRGHQLGPQRQLKDLELVY